MAQGDKIFSIDEKVQLLARDIYDRALLNRSLKLEHFSPSKQIQNLLDEEEYASMIAYLRRNEILTWVFRDITLGINSQRARKNTFSTYEIVVNQPNIRRLLGLKESAAKQVEKGIRLHPEYSYLIINGTEIPLAKGKLHRSLQYWICQQCLKKPNAPVQETDIMAKYATDYDVNARGRAVRDAVYILNSKIEKATGISQLFTYSNGYVVLNADKLR